MKVRVSANDGKVGLVKGVYTAYAPRKGGYLSMARVGDHSIGILSNTATEENTQSLANPWRIDFHRVNLPWINGE
ncbi:hypothetical protein WG904_08285 [Pedobacter sp. Du54]|uniref:hypothetical protein n=1 Tax=Pedobacter anseongensis TaxID=3133439 RepID=UPI0030A6488C